MGADMRTLIDMLAVAIGSMLAVSVRLKDHPGEWRLYPRKPKEMARHQNRPC
jgi:hypothetical protein